MVGGLGGGVVGWVVGGSGKLKIKLNSVQLELELGLSLAKMLKSITELGNFITDG